MKPSGWAVKRRRAFIVIGILLVIALGWKATAQGLGNDVKKETTIASSETAMLGGIGNPPPTDFSVLYMFTGVANEAGNGDDEVTVVHCTNYHPTTAVDVRVQVFPMDAAATYEASLSISSGHTRTFATRTNSAFSSDVLLSPDVPSIFMGSGRVLVKQHSQVICSVQVLDGDIDPPTYAVKLTLFDRYGRIPHHVGRVFLPLMFSD